MSTYKCVILPSVTISHAEQLNLFTLAISDTGDRKSNVFRLLRDPVIAAQDEYYNLNADRIAQSKLEYKLLKKLLAKETSKSDGTNFEYIAAIEKQVREFDLLVPPKLLLDDATSEKLIESLEEQGGSIAIASPEGGLFSTLKTAVTINPTFDAYLKAYTGDSIEVERISRKGNAIKSPKLSLIIACQPQTAQEMIQNKIFRDKGLPARFLIAQCSSMVGARTFDKPEVKSEAIIVYNELIRKLLDGAFSKIDNPYPLTLTDDGRAAYTLFSQSIESKLGENGKLSFMQDWCAKLPGQMLRVAAILAMCDGKVVIDADLISRAVRIAEWFVECAAGVFGGKRESLVSKFLEERTISSKGKVIKTSNLLRAYNLWATVKGKDEMKPREYVGELKAQHFTVSHVEIGNVIKNIELVSDVSET